MKSLIAAAALLVATQAAPALAARARPPVQPQPPREPSLTLYEKPDFRGKSVTLFADRIDLTDTGAVGKARSAQVIGQWRVCDLPAWRGRCMTLTQNVPDLGRLDLAGRIVSASLDMRYNRNSYAPPPPPAAYGRESYEPAPYAYDVQDYSAASPYGPPAMGPDPFTDADPPIEISPYPQMYPYPDYGPGGPAMGPAYDDLGPYGRPPLDR